MPEGHQRYNSPVHAGSDNPSAPVSRELCRDCAEGQQLVHGDLQQVHEVIALDTNRRAAIPFLWKGALKTKVTKKDGYCLGSRNREERSRS
jgi:hypothetical protein